LRFGRAVHLEMYGDFTVFTGISKMGLHDHINRMMRVRI